MNKNDGLFGIYMSVDLSATRWWLTYFVESLPIPHGKFQGKTNTGIYILIGPITVVFWRIK